MLKRLAVVTVGMCVAMSVLTAQADVYKWKDANGRVHYGDQPARGAEKVNGGAVNATAADEASADASDQSKQKRAEECSRRRDQLASYRTASKITETDSLGNQKEFNDDERKKLIERTQQQISESCGDSADGSVAK